MTKEYHRSASLDEALALLQRPNVRTVPLAGGSWLTPQLRDDLPGDFRDSVDAVVDLAELGLSYVERAGQEGQAVLRLGATTTLADLAAAAECRSLAAGLLAKAARQEGPVNLRNAATLGGSIVRAGSASPLLLALSVLDAQVVVASETTRTVALAELLVNPEAALAGALIVELRVPWTVTAGGLARVARTPADQAIVAAAALADSEMARVAIGGVMPLPLLVELNGGDPEQVIAAALDGVDILSDFRGDAEYRRAMAPVLARRALAEARG